MNGIKAIAHLVLFLLALALYAAVMFIVSYFAAEATIGALSYVDMLDTTNMTHSVYAAVTIIYCVVSAIAGGTMYERYSNGIT